MGNDARRLSRMQRRTALKLGVAATVAAGMATGVAPGPESPRAFAAAPGGPVEPGAGSWKTWVLTSGSELRLPPPPDSAGEVGEVRAQAAQRDAQAIDRIEYWDMGAPATRWNEIAITEGIRARMTLRNYRVLALVNVAMADATIAAWDSKYAHNRARPSEVDPSISTAVATPRSPAYPCEHAVAAGAASTVLAYLFPDQAARFAELAQDAASSRVKAGVQFPSDVSAGLELGRAVGAKVVEYARADGTDAVWTGTVPEGPGLWQGANPAEPLAGTWKPWVLSSGSQLRLGPPPAHDSEQKLAELAELQQFQGIRVANPVAFYWARDPVGRPYEGSAPVSIAQAAFRWAVLNHLLWGEQIADKVLQYRLDANAAPGRTGVRPGQRGRLRRGDRLLGQQVRLLGGAPDPPGPDAPGAVPDAGPPDVPVRALVSGRRQLGDARLPVPARRGVLPSRRRGAGVVAGVGRDPLQERRPGWPGARPVGRATGDRASALGWGGLRPGSGIVRAVHRCPTCLGRASFCVDIGSVLAMTAADANMGYGGQSERNAETEIGPSPRAARRRSDISAKTDSRSDAEDVTLRESVG